MTAVRTPTEDEWPNRRELARRDAAYATIRAALRRLGPTKAQCARSLWDELKATLGELDFTVKDLQAYLVTDTGRGGALSEIDGME